MLKKSKLVVMDKLEKLSNACSTGQFFFIFMPHPNFPIVFQIEKSIDDSAAFINNILGSEFELRNKNSSPLGLLVRQDVSFYDIDATKEDHKQDIIELSSNHL
jgi:hypothetical protein